MSVVSNIISITGWMPSEGVARTSDFVLVELFGSLLEDDLRLLFKKTGRRSVSESIKSATERLSFTLGMLWEW